MVALCRTLLHPQLGVGNQQGEEVRGLVCLAAILGEHFLRRIWNVLKTARNIQKPTIANWFVDRHLSAPVCVGKADWKLHAFFSIESQWMLLEFIWKPKTTHTCFSTTCIHTATLKAFWHFPSRECGNWSLFEKSWWRQMAKSACTKTQIWTSEPEPCPHRHQMAHQIIDCHCSFSIFAHQTTGPQRTKTGPNLSQFGFSSAVH